MTFFSASQCSLRLCVSIAFAKINTETLRTLRRRGTLCLLSLLLTGTSIAAQTIQVSPNSVNAYSQGPTSSLLTFGGLVNKQPAEATWCGRLIPAAPDLGTKCDPSNVFGVLPLRYDQSTLRNNVFTDVMSVTPQVARRAYLDAANGNTSTFFYVRRFASTVGGPSEYVPVTIRLSGNGARVPLSLTEVKLSWGVGSPVLFVKSGETLPRVKAEISYTGTGRLKGRWELVKPGETPPEPRDLLPEASLPLDERGTRRRYTEIERFNIYLPPTGQVVLPGPESFRVDETLSGLYLLLLRIEASGDKDSETDPSEVGAGPGPVEGGAVAGFSFPTLRYYVGEVTSNLPAPPAIKLAQVSPADAQELERTSTVEFNWTSVAGASSYRLEIVDLNDSPLLSAILIDAVSYRTPSWFKNKVSGSVFRWRVIAFDAQRNTIAETGWRNLKVN